MVALGLLAWGVATISHMVAGLPTIHIRPPNIAEVKASHCNNSIFMHTTYDTTNKTRQAYDNNSSRLSGLFDDSGVRLRVILEKLF